MTKKQYTPKPTAKVKSDDALEITSPEKQAATSGLVVDAAAALPPSDRRVLRRRTQEGDEAVSAEEKGFAHNSPDVQADQAGTVDMPQILADASVHLSSSKSDATGNAGFGTDYSLDAAHGASVAGVDARGTPGVGGVAGLAALIQWPAAVSTFGMKFGGAGLGAAVAILANGLGGSANAPVDLQQVLNIGFVKGPFLGEQFLLKVYGTSGLIFEIASWDADGKAVLTGADGRPVAAGTVASFTVVEDVIDDQTVIAGFRFLLPTYSGPVLALVDDVDQDATTGTYLDEAEGTPVNLDAIMRGFASIPEGGEATIIITPFTEAAMRLAETAAGKTLDPSVLGFTLAEMPLETIDSAIDLISAAVGVDLRNVKPVTPLEFGFADPNTSLDSKLYGLKLAAFSQLAQGTSGAVSGRGDVDAALNQLFDRLNDSVTVEPDGVIVIAPLDREELLDIGSELTDKLLDYITANDVIVNGVDVTRPLSPTVNPLITSDPTPVLSGTVTLGPGEILTVVLNGVPYNEADGLIISDNSINGRRTWTLQLPDSAALDDGTYEVTAYVDDLAGNTTKDNTNFELVIRPPSLMSVMPASYEPVASPSLGQLVPVQFTIYRTDPNGRAEVDWVILGLSADDFESGLLPSGRAVFVDGSLTTDVILFLPASLAQEASRVATLEISNSSTGYAIDPFNRSASALIEDPNALLNGGPRFAVSATRQGIVPEGFESQVTAITYTVQSSDLAVSTIQYSVVGSGAAIITGDDFASSSANNTALTGLPTNVNLVFDANGLATFNLYVRGDNRVGPDEQFRIVLSGLPQDSKVFGALTGKILTDDVFLSVGAAPVVTDPGPGEVTHSFVITRSGQTDIAHTVTYSIAGLGEQSAIDLAELVDPSDLNGTLQFVAGETEKIVTLTLSSDALIAGYQTFGLTLQPANNVTILNATAVSSIVPNLQDIEFEANLDRVLEGRADSFSYTVTRSGAIDQALTLSWSVQGAGESAATATDFEGGLLPSGTVSFAAGQSSATLTFRTAADTTLEGDEGFQLRISPINLPAGVRLLDPYALGYIADDESAVGFNTASTFSAPEGDIGTGNLSVTISRIGFAGNASTVEWRVSPGTALLQDFVSGQDLLGNNNGYPSGVLTLLPGEVTGIARIELTADAVLEADERFSLVLSNASANTKLIGVDADFPGYSNTATAVIVNDDSVLRIVSPTYQWGEGEPAGMAITVRRDGSTSGTDWVRWSLYSGDTNPADGADVSGSVTPQAVFNQASQSWIDLATLSGSQSESGAISLTKSGYLMVAFNRGQAFQDANKENIPFDRFLLDNLQVSGGGSIEFLGSVTQDNFVVDNAPVTSGSGTVFSPQTPVVLPGAQGNRVVISADTNMAGLHFRITGTDGDGNTVTEVIRGPAGGMVATSRSFASVSTIETVPAKLFLAVQFHPRELDDVNFNDVFRSNNLGYDINLSGGPINGEWLTNDNSYSSYHGVNGADVFSGSDAGRLVLKSAADLSGTQFLVTGGVNLASFARNSAQSWDNAIYFNESFPDSAQIDLEAFLGVPAQVRFEQVNGIVQSLDSSSAASVFTIVGLDTQGTLVRETVSVAQFDAAGLATMTNYDRATGNVLQAATTLGSPGRVMFSYAGSPPSTTLVFTVTGTDANDDTITDQVRLTSAQDTSSGTSKTFHAVTSIVANESFTGTVQVGSSAPVHSSTSFSKVLGIIPANSEIDFGKVEVTVEQSFVVDGTLPGTLLVEHNLSFVRSIEVLPSLSGGATIDVGFEQPTDTYHTLSFNDLIAWSDSTFSANQVNTITLGLVGGVIQVNTGTPGAPVWESLPGNTLDAELLAQGAYRLANPARTRDTSALESAESAQVDAVNALRGMPNGYALRYSDLSSSSWNDAGNDLYDGGNLLDIDGSRQSIWNTSNNTTATSASFGNYVFRTTTSGIALLIDSYDASDFRITGNLGADGNGVRLFGELTGFSGVRVFYQITHSAGNDPGLHKIVITNAGNPTFTSVQDTNDEDFWVRGLEDATFVHYHMLASAPSSFYSEDQLRSFVSSLLPEVPPFNAAVTLSDGNSVSVSGGEELIPVPLSANMLVNAGGNNLQMSADFAGGGADMAFAILKLNAGIASPDAPVNLSFDMAALGRAGIDTTSLSYAPDGMWSTNLQDASDSTRLIMPALSSTPVFSTLARSHFSAAIDSDFTGIYVDTIRHGRLQVNTGTADAPVWTELADFLEDEDTDVLEFSVIDAGRVRYSGNSLIVQGRFDEDGSDQDEQVFTIQNPTPVAPAVAHSSGSVTLTESGYIWVRFANTSDGAEGVDRATISNLHLTGGGSLSVVGQKVLTQAIAQEQALTGAGDIAINGPASVRPAVALPQDFDGSLMVFVQRDESLAHLQSGAYTAVGRNVTGDTVSITGAFTTTDLRQSAATSFSDGTSIRLSGLESLVSIESLRIHEFTSAMRVIEGWGSNSPYQLGEPLISVVAGDFDALSVEYEFSSRTWSERGSYVSSNQQTTNLDLTESVSISALPFRSDLTLTNGSTSGTFNSSGTSGTGGRIISFGTVFPDNLAGATILISGTNADGQSVSETLEFSGDAHVLNSDERYQGSVNYTVTARTGVQDGSFTIQASRDLTATWGDPQAVVAFHINRDSPSFVITGLDAQGQYQRVVVVDLAESRAQLLGVLREIFAIQPTEGFGGFDLSFADAPNGVFDLYEEVPLTGVRGTDDLISLGSEQRVVLGNGISSHILSYKVVGLNAQGDRIEEIIHNIAQGSYRNNDLKAMDGSSIRQGSDGEYPGVFGITTNYFTHIEGVYVSAYHPRGGEGTLSIGSVGLIGRPLIEEQALSPYGEMVQLGSSYAQMGTASRVSLASDQDLSDRTLTITGIGANGQVITETIAGPDNGILLSRNSYLQVTRIQTTSGAPGSLKVGYASQNGGLTDHFVVKGSGTALDPFVGHSTNTLENGSDGVTTAGERTNEADILFYLNLDNANGPVTLNYNLSVQGGAGDSLYVEYLSNIVPLLEGRLEFDDGDSEATILIPIANDDRREADETLKLKLGASSAGTSVDPNGSSTQITIVDDDDSVTIDSAQLDAREGNAQAGEFTVVLRRLDASTGKTVRWQIEGSGGEGQASSDDFSQTSGTVTFAPGSLTATVRLPVVNDRLLEANETFRFVLSEPAVGSGYSLTGITSAAGVIRNDDVRVSITATSTGLPEGSGANVGHVFTLTREGDLSQASSITYQVSASTVANTVGVNGGNFGGTLPGGTLNFAAGASGTHGSETQSLTVTSVGNVDFTGDMSFAVTLGNAAGDTTQINTSPAIGRIAEDDSIVLTSSNLSQAEGTDPNAPTLQTYTLQRTGDTSRAMTLNWAVQLGGADTAKANDFEGGVLPSGQVTFAAGSSTAPLTVAVNADAEIERDERFTLRFTSPTSSTASGTLTAVIVGDDLGFGVDPRVLELTESNAGTTTLQVTLVRAGQSSSAATYDWAVRGVSTDNSEPAAAGNFSGLILGSVTFAIGETEKTIALQIVGNSQFDVNRTFVVDMKDGATTLASSPVLTIQNDDARVGVLVSSSALTEGSSASGGLTLTYIFTRDGNVDQTSTAEWRVSAGSGVTAADFVQPVDALSNGGLPSGLLTFAPGETSKTVNLTVRADSIYEQSENITLALSAPSVGTSVDQSNASATTTVTDDDVLLRFTEASRLQTTIVEGDHARVNGSYVAMSGTDSEFTEVVYTVERVGHTSVASIATWTLTGTNGATPIDFVGPLSGQLTWLADDTSTRTLSVKVRSDLYAGNTEGFRLDLSTSQLGNAVDGDSSITGFITDTDEGLTMASGTERKLRKAEGQSGETEFSWTIQRNGDLSQALDVDFQVTSTSLHVNELDFVGDASAADGADFIGGVLPSGTVSFAAGQATATVTVVVQGDIGVEATESFGVRLTPTRAIDHFSLFSTTPPDQGALQYLNSGTIQELHGVVVRDEAIIRMVGLEIVSPTDGSTLGEANAPAEGDVGFASHFFKIYRVLSVEGEVSVDWRVNDLGTGTAFSDTPLFSQDRRISLSASDFVTAEDPSVGNAGFPSGRATIPAGQEFVVVEVRTRVDLVGEDLTGFSVTISNPTPGSTVDLEENSSLGHIRNDDPLFSIGEAYPTQPDGAGAGSRIWGEGDGEITFRIYRSGDTRGSAEADWQVQFAGLVSGPNGELDAATIARYSASAADFDTTAHPLSGTVVFADGEAYKEVRLRLADDQLAENYAETLRIALTAARVTEPGSTKVAGISALAGSMEQVIIDNDQGSVVAITEVVTSEASLAFLEGTSTANKTVTYTITRTGSDLSAGQLGWFVEGGQIVSVTGATATSQHSGLIAFANGETSKTLTLELSNNSWVEGDSVKTLTLIDARTILANYLDTSSQVATPYALDAPFWGSDGTASVVRNGVYLVDSANARELSDLNHNGLLPDSGSIVVDAERASASVTVQNDETRVYLRDTLIEVPFRAVPFLSVMEPDTGTLDLTILMGRQGRTDQTLLVDYTIFLSGTADDADLGSTRTGTLTLASPASGGSTYGTVDYEIVIEDIILGDTLVEARENFSIRFSNLRTNTNDTANLFFQQINTFSNAGQLASIDLPVWLETSDVLWSVEATPTDVNEADIGESVYTFTIVRPVTGNNYAGPATVNWTVEGSGDHPVSADDFVNGVTGGSVSFAAGEDSKQVTVRVRGDQLAEQNETFTVGIVSASRGQVDLTRTTMTVLNEDTNISVSDATVVEGGSGVTQVTYTITRTGSLTNPATGAWSLLLDGSAELTDFSGPTSGTFSFPADPNSPRYGVQTTTFTVGVVGDSLAEVNDTFTVRLSGLTGIDVTNEPGVNKLVGTGVIQNDEAVFSISAGAPVTEGGVPGQRFVVTRSHDTAQDQTVTWTVGTEGGSHGVNPADFAGATFPTGSLTFEPGDTVLEFFVPTQADDTAELDEAFTVTLSAGTGTTLAMVQDAIAYGGVLNDDEGPVVVAPDAFLSVADASAVVEGNSGNTTVEFVLTRTGAIGFSGTVQWSVVPTNNASNNAENADFGGSLPSGTLTLPAGESSITLRIPVVTGDSLLEGDETFQLVLSNPSPGLSITDASALAIILNDDARFDIVNAVSTYAAAPGTNEGTGTDPTTITFTVSRTGDTSAAGTVNWDVARRDADVDFGTGDFVTTGGATYPTGSISFAAGESSKTVSVQVVADSLPELDETFRIRLTSPSAGHTIGAMNSFFKIVNDDVDVIRMSTAASVIAEGDVGFTDFTLTLTRSLSLTHTTVDWVATPIGDFPLDALRLREDIGVATFEIGELSTTITVQVSNDLIGDFDRTFRVAISNPVVTLADGSVDNITGAVIDAQSTSVNLTLDNDDAAYTIALRNNGRFEEGNSGEGALIQFYVYRDGDATGAAQIDWVLAPSGAHPVNITDFGGFWPSGTVSFADGETEKLVQARVVGDGQFEVDENFKITLSNLRPAEAGGIILIQEVQGVILNDDNGVSLTVNASSVVEGDAGSFQPVIFGVNVTGVAGQRVTVNFAFEGTGAYPANMQDIQWAGATGATVRSSSFDTATMTGSVTLELASNGTAAGSLQVNVVGDIIMGNDEQFRLRITSATNASVVTSSLITTIVNDDSLVTLSPVVLSQREGDGSTYIDYVFTVTRTGDLTRAAVVNYALEGFGDNQAVDSDFDFTSQGVSAKSGILSFAAGQDVNTIRIRVLGDSAFESDESFAIRLLPGTATAGVAAAEIDSSGSLSVAVIRNDDLADLLINGVVTKVFEGNDPEAPRELVYEVIRNGDNSQPLSISYTLTGAGSAVASGWFVGGAAGTFTLAAGESRGLLTLPVAANLTSDGDRSFQLQISAAGFQSPAAVGGEIIDDESGISIALSSRADTVEGDSGVTQYVFTVTRQGNTGAVDVAWALTGVGVNAVISSDFLGAALPSGMLRFVSNEMVKTLTISVMADMVVESDELMRITLTGSSDPAQRILVGFADAIIINDDSVSSSGSRIETGDGSALVQGGAGSDVIVGGNGSSLIYARSGDDMIRAGGGADIVYAEEGDDTVYLDADNLQNFTPSEEGLGRTFVNGGEGFDTVAFDVSGASIDLTAIMALVDGLGGLRGIECIDVTDASGLAANTLTLDATALILQDEDIFSTTDGTGLKQLMVKGGAGDSVVITDFASAADGTWRGTGTYVSDGATYNLYLNDDLKLQLLVQDTMSASIFVV